MLAASPDRASGHEVLGADIAGNRRKEKEMAEVRWIKLFIDMWNNRKIKQIETLPDGDTVLIIWLKLLTLAGNINDGGMVYFTKDIPFNESMLANEFGRSLETVKMALNVFQKFGMIEVVDDMIYVSNWEKYQNRERLDDLREYNRIKQREHRERVNLLSTMSIDSQDIERREKKEDKEEDIEKEKKKEKRPRFVPPTLEEIHRYCWEKGLRVDEHSFFDYYEEANWVDSKGNKVRNWKQKLITWAKYDRNKKPYFSAQEMEVPEETEEDLDALREKMFGPEWREKVYGKENEQ